MKFTLSPTASRLLCYLLSVKFEQTSYGRMGKVLKISKAGAYRHFKELERWPFYEEIKARNGSDIVWAQSTMAAAQIVVTARSAEKIISPAYVPAPRLPEYQIPEPQEQPAKALVIAYKIEKKVPYDSREWDNLNFKRCMPAAQSVLIACGTFESAYACIRDIGDRFNSQEINWTLETIARHAHEWKAKNGGNKNEHTNRQRFLSDLARQRATRKAVEDGTFPTALLGALGNRAMDGNRSGQARGIDHRENVSTGKRFQFDVVESARDRMAEDSGSEGQEIADIPRAGDEPAARNAQVG